MTSSYRELAMRYLRKAAACERSKNPLAYYYRAKAANALRDQARVDSLT